MNNVKLVLYIDFLILGIQFIAYRIVLSINYNERNSLSILDTSLIMEGDNVYVYKVDKENTVKKVPVEIGLRKKGIVEI